MIIDSGVMNGIMIELYLISYSYDFLLLIIYLPRCKMLTNQNLVAKYNLIFRNEHINASEIKHQTNPSRRKLNLHSASAPSLLS